MARHSRHQDQLLIETAKKLLPHQGISGMSLQLVADQCGVNLGMFHYYFGSKKKFVQKVLESVSKDILDEVEKKSLEGKTTLDRLRSALSALGLHVRDHREIFTSMVQDMLNRDSEVSHFMTIFMGKEMEILLPLFQLAQREGSIEKIPLRQCVAFCMSSIMFPTLVSETILRATRKNKNFVSILNSETTTDEAIRQRVDMALKALSTLPRKVL